MLKKTFLIFFLFLAGAGVYSQENERYYFDKLSYENFVEWIKFIDIPGYKLAKLSKDGDEKAYNVEYAAYFLDDKNNHLDIRLGSPDIYYQYDELRGRHEVEGPFEVQGFPAVYVYSSVITKPRNMTYLLVQAPNLNATFSIMSVSYERTTKDELVSVFKRFNLQAIDNAGKIKWPSEIPIPMRMPGTLLSLKKTEGEIDNGFAYVAKIETDPSFRDWLKYFFDRTRGWFDLARYKNVSLAFKNLDSFDKINPKGGDVFEILYYQNE